MVKLSRCILGLFLVGILASSIQAGAQPFAKLKIAEGGLAVLSLKNGVEVSNGSVKCRFTLVDTVYKQDFYAIDKKKRWRMIASGFQPSRNLGLKKRVNSLLIPRLGNERQFTGSVLSKIDTITQTKDSIVVVLHGISGKHSIAEKLVMRADTDFVYMEITDELLDRVVPRFEFILSHFVFQPDGKKLSVYKTPEFIWTPNLRPQDDQVIGDHVFRSPAIILQQEELFAALVPDLDTLGRYHSISAILDLDLKNGATDAPLIAYGLAGYTPTTRPHTYYTHDTTMVVPIPQQKLKYSFQLFLSAASPRKKGYKRVVEYFWSRYGHRYYQSPHPQVMPFAEYAKACYPSSFTYVANEKNGLKGWQEFEIDGKKVGGVISGRGQENGNIPNQAWFCNLRSGWGMYWFAKRMHHEELARRGLTMVEFALAAPQNEGIFPSCYNVQEKRWLDNYWNFDKTWLASFGRDIASAGWTIKPEDYTVASYQTASASWTCIWFVQWYRAFVQDPRILPYCRRYADFLLSHTDKNGCVPAWFTKTLKPCRQLRFNAEGGVHAWFLAELYNITKDKKYLAAAERMASFVSKQILPERKWYDFETFYSCSPKPEGMFDQHTGQWPQNTLSMQWAAGAFAKLYESTGKKEYLNIGMDVLDYLSLYQTVWPISYIRVAYTYGGFGVQNTDSELEDARQSQFGDTYFDYYRLTSKPEYFERGVAALRASLAMVNYKEVKLNGVYPNPNYPEGLEPGNCGHGGKDVQNGRSGFDWGEGSALTGVAYAITLCGSVFIDIKHNQAFAIDGCAVKSLKIDVEKINLQLSNGLIKLDYAYVEPYELIVRGVGGDQLGYAMTINRETKVVTKAELERGVVVNIQ